MLPFFSAITAPLVGLNTPIVEYVDLAKRHGYKYVEFSRTQINQIVKIGFENARKLLKTADIRIASFFIPVEWRKDEELFRKDLKKLVPIAHIASRLGGSCGCTWVLPNYQTPPDVTKRWVSERLCLIDQVLADHGIRFGLEVIGPAHFLHEPGNTFIYGFENMLAFAEELSPNIGLVIDSFHWHCLNASQETISAIPSQRIVYVHINDAPYVPRELQRDGERLLPGSGTINLMGFLRGLHLSGYEGPVGIESYGPALAHLSSDEAAASAHRSWRLVIEEYGKKYIY